MTSENQVLLDAIRAVVKEELVPLSQGVDGLTERVDGLTVLTERIELRLTNIEVRLTNLEARVERLEGASETLDTRTNQLSIDLRALSDELLDLKERVKDGFSGVKRESEQAYVQIGKLQTGQRTQQKRIKALEDQVMILQQRLDQLEARQGK
jgi:chromosome segregation ATPase